MNHLIIGSGIVGEATGILFSSHNEKVVFYDKNKKVLDRLKKNNYDVVYDIAEIDWLSFDLIWVCTAEWNVSDVLKMLSKENPWHSKVMIRSTMPIGETKKLNERYKQFYIAHIPEFLREKNYLEDVFNPDRIVIGVNDYNFGQWLKEFFIKIYPSRPIMVVSSTTSELIKLASNGWLSAVISYWNEILRICRLYDVNPQEVANGCILDHRISSYGSMMLGESFGGFCLPKDLVSLHNAFKDKKTTSEFLEFISRINEENKRK